MLKLKIGIFLFVFFVQGFVLGAFVVDPDDEKRIESGKNPSYIENIEHDKKLGKVEPAKRKPSKKIPGSLLSKAEPISEEMAQQLETGSPGVAEAAEKEQPKKRVAAQQQGGSIITWQLVCFILALIGAAFVYWRSRVNRSPDI